MGKWYTKKLECGFTVIWSGHMNGRSDPQRFLVWREVVQMEWFLEITKGWKIKRMCTSYIEGSPWADGGNSKFCLPGERPSWWQGMGGQFQGGLKQCRYYNDVGKIEERPTRSQWHCFFVRTGILVPLFHIIFLFGLALWCMNILTSSSLLTF